MGITTAEREIGDGKYVTKTFPAREAIRTGRRLIALLGPAVEGVAGSDADRSSLATLAASKEAVRALVAAASSPDADGLIVDLFRHTYVLGKDDDGVERKFDLVKTTAFDDWFAGRLVEMGQAAAFVLEHSFADFHELLGTLIGARAGQAQGATSPTSGA